MTLNELNLIYFDARKKLQDELSARHEDDISTEPHLAGIRAVVEALRDEMTLGWEDDRPWGDVADVKKFLNKILASDGEEAAGTDTAVTETKPEAIERSAPAAAPVCPYCNGRGYTVARYRGDAYQEQCPCGSEAAR